MTTAQAVLPLEHPDFLVEVLPSNKPEDIRGNSSLSVSGFYLVLQRRFESYIWLYFAPCFLMVCTSWVSFAVSIDAVPGRLGLLLTILLMLINMNNSISQTIPKSTGICPLILWILMSIIFIVFALVEYFIILTSVKFGSQETKIATKKMRKVTSAGIQIWASSLDKTSLMVFPLAYFVSVLIFFLALLL